MDVAPDSDWNGSNIQRRRVYARNPVHQLKHHIQFDWQPDDHTYFDTHGYKGKQNVENAVLRQKYTDITDEQLEKKYVEGVDAHPLKKIKKYQGGKDDSLTMELSNFNQSKNIAKESGLGDSRRNPQKTQHRPKRQVMSRSLPPERQRKHDTARKLEVVSPQEQQVRIEPAPQPTSPPVASSSRNIDMLSSSKPNYETIDPQPFYAPPASPTYRTLDNPSPTRPTFSQQPKLQPFSVASRVSPPPPSPHKMLSANHSPANSYDYSMVSRYGNPSKLVGAMYTGVSMQDYPFRNVKPDNLEYHLRDKTKADHRRRVKVDLNLHDYHKP